MNDQNDGEIDFGPSKTVQQATQRFDPTRGTAHANRQGRRL